MMRKTKEDIIMKINYIVYYLILINLIAFFLMAADKWKARHHAWRIPEKTLFLSGVLGGCPGALAGMYLFRHKTKHLTFVLGMPAILILQLAAFLYLTLL